MDLDEHVAVRLRPSSLGNIRGLILTPFVCWQSSVRRPNNSKQNHADVLEVSVRLTGGRGVMHRAKRSAFVSRRLSIATPSTRGASIMSIARTARRMNANFCILTESVFESRLR